MLPAFKQYLTTLKLSPVSRKLYVSDTKKFLSWLGDVIPSEVEGSSYTKYLAHLRSQATAPSMLKRTLASLKQFGTFLSLTYNVPNPASPAIASAKAGPTNYLTHFTNYLNRDHLSPLTIKSYKSDITRYLDWSKTHNSGAKLPKLLTDQNIEKYLTHLLDSGHALPSTLERKQQSLARFRSWYSDVYANPAGSPEANDSRAPAPSHSRSEGLPHSGSVSPTRVWSLASIISFGVLILFISTLSIFAYRQFSRDATLTAAYPSTPVTPNRQLSFQGRLENASGTPITTATDMVFKLFTASSGGTELYTTGTCAITPDADGVFNTQIGSTCGSAIASSVFTENAGVWLEVTIVAETLTPRQQIATVAYALNSETLQGFPLSSTVSAIRNTVVPMNQFGEIIIGEQSPRLTGVSGTFQISAPALSIITATGTSGNISIAPDGTGQVNLTGNTTSTNFFNVSNAQLTTGSLLTGTVANANTGFLLLDLLSGVSPTSKFSVTDAGNVTLAGDLTVSGSNVTLPNNSINPNEIFTTSQTDEYCLTYETTGATWEWQTCGGGPGSGSNWRITAGALSPLNDTLDLLVGNVATASAKFAVNATSGNVALAGDLTITGDDLIMTTNTANYFLMADGVNYNPTSPADARTGLGLSAGGTGDIWVEKAGDTMTGALTNTLATGNSLVWDTNTLIVDATNDKVGIGNAAPVGKLDVSGAVTGKALAILNETGDQNILTASASGVTRMNVTTEGYVEAQRFADLANTTYYLDPAAAGVSLAMASGSLTSAAADGATAVAFTLNSTNTLSTQGSKLLSLQNNGTEKMYLDASGNLYVAGTIVSGNGTSMLLTNKSGGIVASKAIVVLDTSNNTSFTTTTTPYSKAGFGVVVGVGLGVANDADGDGVCDADDICMVAYGGSVNVTVKNATTAVKGDYLFTSDTAGSAVASAKQYDGLVGIVDDTTNAASGYLKMIFKVQPQVTAAAAIDKTTKHNEYWLYADQYSAVGEGSNTDTNLLQRGLAFDTFTDTTKTDSANTTVSAPTQFSQTGVEGGAFNTPATPFRTGLIGGQTLATSTTDNAGNTYLGSNTVNDQYLYDRTRDSSPQVQVELGIDPNWYNGVTLSVATTSAQFSQNSTITQPNPNLSTTYNGSLIKVTGTDTTPRTIYITIKSPTTFDWTNYQGDAATGVTITPGTAQALGTTGVSATFTNARYNTGDVFKIASWFVEPASSTRGAKQQFPERSYIVIENTTTDIIDADTQKLWMRFTDRLSQTAGTMLNGTLWVTNNQNGGWPGMEIFNFVTDFYVSTRESNNYTSPDSTIAGRNSSLYANVTYSQYPYIVNKVVNDVSAAVIPNAPTGNQTVSGWGYRYVPVAATEYSITETVNLPYKFNNLPSITGTIVGYSTSVPVNIGSCTNLLAHVSGTQITNISTTSFSLNMIKQTNYDVLYACYSWTATGQVSPRTYVAAATDAGVTVINETDSTAYSYSDVTSDHYNNVSLTSAGRMYALNETQAQLEKWRDIASNTASETNGTYDKMWDQASTPALTATAPTIQISASDLYVTEKTSTINSNNDTIYVGTNLGTSVIQDNENWPTAGDGSEEASGSVKYYTKDYISEEMVGDIRGMWPFNEASGSLLDASVKANYLEDENAPTYAASAVRGTGLTFDGTADHLCSDADNNAACDNDTDFNMGTGSFSISTWFKHSATITGTDTIIDHFYNTTPAAVLGWRVTMNSSGQIVFGIDDDATSFPEDSVTSNLAYNDNLWHQVTAVKTSTTDIRLYIDGVQVGTPDTAISATGTLTGTGVIMTVGSDCSVGAACATGANFWDGSLDELTITATALSAGQIKNMYQVGYRALQSHGTGLGGGAADTNQQLGFISTGTNTVGAAQPDWNNQYMYVGTNSTTLGAVSKIDLNSDTNIKTYNSSANVPAGGALLVDEDTKSLAVGYNLEAVGSATTGVKTMGVDNNATATSGNFIGKTTTTAESFTQAYLWAQYITDSSDASNTIQVWASNDGGSNYYQCNLTNTDSSRSPPEYEYFCQFNTAGSSLKTKFVMARGSTKTNTYVSKYGISWIDSNAIAGSALGSGLYTGTNASVANGSYIDVAHNQNSNDVVTNGWVYNTTTSKWEQIGENNNTDATGGTITYNGGYTIHTFTTGGTFTSNSAGTVEYLVVGGGGGGGGAYSGGGGGAGGFRTATGFAVTAQGYTITVGGGGAGGTGSGTNGSDSVFSTITSTGGAGGASGNGVNGSSGGSGSGGSMGNAGYGTGGAGNTPSTSPSQGNNGGNGRLQSGNDGGGGGGGGASAVGGNAALNQGGNGGNGTASSITGTSVTYAGGGGGGQNAISTPTTIGTGGTGGGGAGGRRDNGAYGIVPVAGTANTGGGGGGAGGDSGFDSAAAGGSGIVIVRYLTNSLSAFKITQQDANTVRLYNYSGAAQNLRLDVITGGLGRNAGTVSLAPAAADVDSQDSTNSIWINKTGSGGTLLKLQQSGTDVLNLSSTALTLTGNFLPGTDNTYSLGATSSARFKDLFLGPASLHIQSKSTDSGYPTLGLDYALGINTAGSLVTSLNGTSNALMTITQGGNVGIGTTAPGAKLEVSDASVARLLLSSAGQSDLLMYDSGSGTDDKYNQIVNIAGFTYIRGLNDALGAITYNFLTMNHDTGNVGIGTTSPANKLDLAITAQSALTSVTQSVANSALSVDYSRTANYYVPGLTWYSTNNNATKPKAGIFMQDTNTGSLMFFGTSSDYATGINNQALTINNVGSVGIGDTTPTEAKLSVVGSAGGIGISVVSDSTYGINSTGTTVGGHMTAADCDVYLAYSEYAAYSTTCSNGYAPSDARLKKDVNSITSSLEIIDQINPVTFFWKEGSEQATTMKKQQYGVVAQELQGILPDLVGTIDMSDLSPLDGDDSNSLNRTLGITYLVDYQSLIPIALSGIKELNIRTKDLTLTDTGDLVLTGNSPDTYAVATPTGITSRIGAFASATIAKLTAGLTRTNELQVDMISPISPDQPITITGPVVISNQTSDTPELVVDGELVAATISARLAKLDEIQADTITARNIVADTISANHIEGLDLKIESSITDRIKARLALLTGNSPTAADIPAPEATNSAITQSTIYDPQSMISTSSASLASADIDFVTVNNYLAVIGQAVMTTLTVNNMLYTNSIQSNEVTLALQPLGGIINLADSTLIIDSSGEVAINGDLTVSGKILADSAELNTLSLGNPSSATSSALGKLLSIYNEDGIAVATIDASGSANLASLTTNMITIAASAAPWDASSASYPSGATPSGLLTTATTSNATAGESVLISPNTELTINSPYITPNSLVYLTPTTNTDNKVLFVKSKNSCDTPSPSPSEALCVGGFTVAIDLPASSDISFNWWVIQLGGKPPN